MGLLDCSFNVFVGRDRERAREAAQLVQREMCWAFLPRSCAGCPWPDASDYPQWPARQYYVPSAAPESPRALESQDGTATPNSITEMTHGHHNRNMGMQV